MSVLFNEAQDLIDKIVKPLGLEKVNITEANDRWLSSSTASKCDNPKEESGKESANVGMASRLAQINFSTFFNNPNLSF